MPLREGRGKFSPQKLRLEKHTSCSDDWHACDKSAFHENYIPICDAKNLNLDPLLAELVEVRARLTGLICCEEGNYKNYGTCFVQTVTDVRNKPYPFSPGQTSRKSPVTPWAQVTVSTALHVATADGVSTSLGDKCEVDFDVYSDDDDKRKTTDKSRVLTGLTVHSTEKEGDWCLVSCVTQNKELIEELHNLIERNYALGNQLQKRYEAMKQEDRLVIIISHPHGCAKRLSIGKLIDKFVDKEVREHQDHCDYSYVAATCSGSSGAAVYIQGKWIDGFGFWFGHPHGHRGSYEDNTGQSSSGVEAV